MISVIVPVFKTEKYIHNCVDSILAQTYHDLQIILVDDGSPDKCGLICDEYAQKDSRIEVIHQTNSGVHQSRLNGLKTAKGEWSTFVDSDDYLPPDAFELLINTSEGFDMVSGKMVLINDEKDQIQNYPYSIKETGLFSGTEIIKEILHHHYAPNIIRLIVKTNVLLQSMISIPRNIYIGEDMLFFISICKHINKAFGIPNVVYYYRLQPSSITHTHKIQLQDIDAFDIELEKLIDNSVIFSEGLFRNRMFETMRFIAMPHFEKTRIKDKVLETYSHFPIKTFERFLVFLCKIDNFHLRKLLFSLGYKLLLLKNKVTQ